MRKKEAAVAEARPLGPGRGGLRSPPPGGGWTGSGRGGRLLVHPLDPGLQRHRAPGHVRPPLLERRGAPRGRALRGPVGGRGHAVQAGGSAREGAAVVRAQAGDRLAAEESL